MATNDFLTFAGAAGSNVITQSAYASLSAQQTGFQSGVSQSAQLNKVWRQSSIMAAVLAQFAADYSGQNSTDDGTTATLESNLVAAIRSAMKTSVILADTGAANAYTAVNVPPLTSGTWVDGVVQQVKIAHANTAASTYAPDGLTSIPIYGLGLQPLQGGELALNGTAVLMRLTIAGVNGGNPIAVLMECAGGAQQVAPATKSQHAVNAAQVPGKNLAINPRFAVNQRGYVSGTATASGTYMVDRWKSSLASSSLTFTAAPQGQQVTVAGQTQQIVERENVPAGTYTLSWVGTAQARVYNSGAGAPSFAASPVTVALDGTQNVVLEFNAGTLDQIKFESGSFPTAFQAKMIAEELRDCQRYFEKGYNLTQAPGATYTAGTGPFQFGGVSGANIFGSSSFRVSKRAIPSMGFYDAAGSSSHVSYYNGSWNNGLSVGSASAGQQSFTLIASNTGTTVVDFQWTADADL